jgi:hypothetical protein
LLLLLLLFFTISFFFFWFSCCRRRQGRAQLDQLPGGVCTLLFCLKCGACFYYFLSVIFLVVDRNLFRAVVAAAAAAGQTCFTESSRCRGLKTPCVWLAALGCYSVAQKNKKERKKERRVEKQVPRFGREQLGRPCNKVETRGRKNSSEPNETEWMACVLSWARQQCCVL